MIRIRNEWWYLKIDEKRRKIVGKRQPFVYFASHSANKENQRNNWFAESRKH